MLKKIDVDADEFDGDNFIAHSTIALDLSPEEFDIAESKLENYNDKSITTKISKVGLFLYVDGRHWIVIATEKFRAA